MSARLKMSAASLLLAAGLATAVAACGGDGGSSVGPGGKVTLRYGLWDSVQQPVYQKCADAFERQNPKIKIKIEMHNWGDYWGGLSRGFIAETAPDVFTDHLAKYPQYVSSQVIEPLATDGVDFRQYLPGLASCGSRLRASSTATPRTGTRSRSSSTRACSRTPA